MSRDLMGNGGRELRGTNAMVGFNCQDKEFVLDAGMHLKPIAEGCEKRHHIV